MTRILGILIIVGSIVAGWYWSAYQTFLDTPLAVPDEGLVLNVTPGTTLKRLSSELAGKGVLTQPDFLYWHARWENLAHRIRAGEYLVSKGTRPKAFLELLVRGKTISYSLTLLEGWNFKQVMAAVRRNPILKRELDGLDFGQIMERMGQPGVHPEGRFFPDTYAFPRGTTDTEFLRRAFDKMQQELDAAWETRNKKTIQVKSREEALILASIIEKETGVAHERPEISGVFTRRLRLGMKLQTDPTVIYGMGDRFDGNIRRKDLREDTPYNTYVHKGLPPTPICMPGRAALDAALNPKEGKSLFFVSRGDGTHVFSATLEQHNAAVRKYQLKQ
jgi:UPF0755 protein